MERWLASALDYIPSWIDFQVRQLQQPGCLLAIVHDGKVVLEHATGLANLRTGEKLTPRHRFRIASHSKSFTAAGILKLRERKKLGLDDPVGKHVRGLHRGVAEVRLSQLLSHGAGITRDGDDAGWFVGRKPYPDKAKMMEILSAPPLDRARDRAFGGAQAHERRRPTQTRHAVRARAYRLDAARPAPGAERR